MTDPTVEDDEWLDVFGCWMSDFLALAEGAPMILGPSPHLSTRIPRGVDGPEPSEER